MKNLRALSAMVIMMSIAMVFTSCKDDDDKEEGSQIKLENLNAVYYSTSYVYTEYENGKEIENIVEKYEEGKPVNHEGFAGYIKISNIGTKILIKERRIGVWSEDPMEDYSVYEDTFDIKVSNLEKGQEYILDMESFYVAEYDKEEFEEFVPEEEREEWIWNAERETYREYIKMSEGLTITGDDTLERSYKCYNAKGDVTSEEIIRFKRTKKSNVIF